VVELADYGTATIAMMSRVLAALVTCGLAFADAAAGQQVYDPFTTVIQISGGLFSLDRVRQF